MRKYCHVADRMFLNPFMTSKKPTKKCVLIIEDEQTILKMLVEKFMLEGLEAIAAIVGVQGLELAFSKHPDIILLDIIMPRMSGLEVLEKLRNDPWGASVPVIMLTNVDDGSYVDRANTFHVSRYLTKINTTPSEIFACVQSLLP